MGIVVCSLLFHNSEQPSNGGPTNEEKQSRIAKFNEFAPMIEALSVSGSLVFVIWATCLRKTRRDRMDELKEEMQILLSEGWAEKIIKNRRTKDEFFHLLRKKFQKTKYKRLHQSAYNELDYEGKNEVTRRLEKMEENQRYRRELLRQDRRDFEARRK